jgi:dipeptidyl aminopeptidase/acylaminoacyl peptidase
MILREVLMKLVALLFLLSFTEILFARDLIVYTAQTQEDTGNEPMNSEIFLMDVSSKTTKRLTRDLALDYEPALSPDGRHVAYITDRFKYDLWGTQQVMLQTITSGTELRIDVGFGKWCGKPAFSADGKVLFFSMATSYTTDKPMSSYKIFAYDIEQKTLKSIYADQPGNFFDLAPSPDGRSIAFRHAYDGYQFVKVMDLSDGKNILLNPDHPRQNESSPAWRGHEQITMLTDYGDNDGMNKSVFDVALNGSSTRQILKDPSIFNFYKLCWFDENRGVAAAQSADYELNLFLIDHSKLTQLTDTKGETNWSFDPDCRTIK